MEKFYVASSFRNVDAVNFVSKQLVNKGYVHTYDWTKNPEARTLEDLKEIGQNEKDAVKESDFIVVLLPGGKGTHIELGIGLGLGKKIFLYSQDGAINHIETTSTFYHLPEVEKCYGTLDEFVEKVINQMPINQEVF
ncbi:nucleoside 2-deoxyribosyltransferase [Mesobacillus subterraneus]|uniref:nucleoside 2-deoxyribosyltransferase n=1 Tax=Mesobacillus subterraneus TaxID=285983 RepID=UPI00203E3246|nr:nucleoside 2-deoxyribosyltransferase [Mesobacillus subterraneus]MCM3575339.1 nucleoside 2-deoxyribosyltransferase [Mesobacillus subterraneus]